MATSDASTVLLVDLDNTLIDADAARAAIDARLRAALGAATAERFWAGYEETRASLGRADIREAMLRLGAGRGDASLLAAVADAVYGVDYATQRFPGALDALAHARSIGVPVLVTDGDPGFQRHKARASGIDAAVEGRVLVTSRKELELDDIALRFPAARYVVVDDKPAILASIKSTLGDRVTTVHIEQGRYAGDAGAAGPPPDVRLPSIAAFAGLDAASLSLPAPSPPAPSPLVVREDGG